MIDPVKAEMFRNRLSKVFKHKSKLARRQQILCYRIYDHDLPEFPFSIELYEDQLYIAEYLRRHGMEDEVHDAWMDECKDIIAEIVGIPIERMNFKLRKRMSHKDEQYEKISTEKEYSTVLEDGLKFLVNLTDYLDTGLFLDHRITRKMVRNTCANKRVLNLFCYTGSFSVYAAAGGASSVTSVDLSKTYLAWAEDNMTINLFKDKQAYQFIHADVKQYLKTLQPNSFDLVIMDPPTFSNSKRMKDILDIQRDHAELINDVLEAMTPGGQLYFSTNFVRFQLDATAIHSTQIKDITKATTPFDFEGKLKRWCYLINK
ncbi:class I SAM-dependent methyltransferase [Sediminibacterium sp.]|uniref:class I SAM-dependent methyltransferase n=1 Tax=Sediminibacterium sp. TaxID=1917865 RepID=UPI00271BFCEC|nr:class I SAM-dependent methyltransferase [Sediminibacterium sp.]MDO8995445.1 class I SAM-dependent methyltransferase [Sediminibacterium sp.]MDP1972762.1 class I SAM-dependent methyltransferase [Sediminibacterium sp.]MDP2422003.1 class I SAM-dependent methyltransferase [Sediminibacterium sp.]